MVVLIVGLTQLLYHLHLLLSLDFLLMVMLATLPVDMLMHICHLPNLGLMGVIAALPMHMYIFIRHLAMLVNCLVSILMTMLLLDQAQALGVGAQFLTLSINPIICLFFMLSMVMSLTALGHQPMRVTLSSVQNLIHDDIDDQSSCSSDQHHKGVFHKLVINEPQGGLIHHEHQ